MIANDDVRSITWPVTPVFPAPPAAPGNIITSQWHNQLNQAAKDIWTDLQALNAAVIPAPVATVFGRTGAVVAVAGDYTAAMVTNAVSTLGSYADPAWLTSLAYSKLSGAPATFPPTAHVHSAADITTGIFAVARLGSGTPDSSTYLRGDGSWQPLPPVAAHVHSAADITSGVMAPARLGTGTASAEMFLRGDGSWAIPPGGGGGAGTGNMLFRGPWADGVGYAVNDVVVYGNGQFIRTVAGSSSVVWTPLNRAAWIASSTHGSWPAGPPSMAIDADPVNTWWSSDDIATNFIVDLGTPQTFSRLGQTGITIYAVKDYEVYVSDDGVNWGIPVAAGTWNGIGPNYATFPAVTKRWCKLEILTQLNNNNAKLTDFQLYSGAGGPLVDTANWDTLSQPQTPWQSNIDGAGFRLYSASHIGVGNNLATMPAAVSGPHLLIGPTAADGTFGRVSLCANAAAGSVGAIAFCNYAIAGGEKRIAQINGAAEGTGNSGAIFFYTWNAGVNAERMRLTPAGNVGIATGNPQALLHIAGPQQATPATAAQLRITEPSGNVGFGVSIGAYADTVWKGVIQTGANTPVLLLEPSGGNVCVGGTEPGARFHVQGGRGIFSTVSERYSVGLQYNNGAPSAWLGSDLNGDFIVSNSGGAEVMRTTATGYMGIGTNNPKARIHTLGAGQVGTAFETVSPAGGVFPEMIYVQQADGAAGSGGGVLFGWPSGPFAAIKAYVQNGGGNSVGEMRFYTRAALADTFLTCRFIIGASNTYCVGDLTVTGTVTPGYVSASGNIHAAGILSTAGALRIGNVGVTDYAMSRNGTDGYMYTDGLQAGYTGYVWRVDCASATREVLRIGNDGNTVIGPKGLASTQLLTLRKDGIAAFPAQGTPTQPGGFFRIQTYDVGLDFGIYPNGDCWIQPYNGITNLTQPYALTLCPLTGTKLGLLKVPGVSPLSIGQLPTSASGLAAGDVYRDGSGFLKIV